MSSYRAFVKRPSFVFGAGGILAYLGFILGRPLVFLGANLYRFSERLF